VASVLNSDPLANSTVPIAFDPTGPLAEPGVSIDPTDDLYDGQAIAVSAWGLEAGAAVAIGQCATTDDGTESCETEIAVFAPRSFADETGRLDTTVWAQAEFKPWEGDLMPCRPSATCTLQVDINAEGAWPYQTEWSFPISFDPDAPLAEPPIVTLDPADDLVDGQVVDVTVTGLLERHVSLILVQCVGEISPANCDPSTSRWTSTPDVDTTTFPVRAVITTDVADDIDCRSPAAGCYLAVTTDLDAPERRWGTAVLAFDAEAPLAAPPSVRIVPAGPIEDRTYATVIGSGFPPGSGVLVAQCANGSFLTTTCSAAGQTAATADDDGRIEVTHPMLLSAGPADCGKPGQCEPRVTPSTATEAFDERTSAVTPVTVSPVARPERYLDPVFDVEVTAGIVYGTGVDEAGEDIELTMDVYEPMADDAIDRPVLLWGTDSAVEFARRGFVVVVTHLDVAATRESIELGYHNTTPVLTWLADHADELRIDTERIAAAGSSRGGFIATSLAYAPDASAGEEPGIAAAISIAGGSIPSLIEAGEPPALLFNGDADTRVPISIAEATCEAAHAVGVTCTLVVYEGWGHELAAGLSRIYDIWDRSAAFLVDELGLAG
jgi:predicted esterase